MATKLSVPTNSVGAVTEQHYTCGMCSKSWSRQAARGRVPRLCPECRATASGKRIARCAWCDHTALIRRDSECCSRRCSLNMRMVPTCLVPQPPLPKPQREQAAPRQPRRAECDRCAADFTTWQTNARVCSRRCGRKQGRLRRRVREANTYGEWRWSDFMRIAQRFDYCCAYCGDKPDQLDPDHVVPLARQGHNVTTNLLPACRACNCDKRDLLLSEWNPDRARRGLPPRTTTWAASDSRVWHLTIPVAA